VVIVKGEGAVLGVNLEHPIATNEKFDAQWCVCVLMELSLGAVSRVPRHWCIRWGACAPSGRCSFGGLESSFGVSSPH